VDAYIVVLPNRVFQESSDKDSPAGAGDPGVVAPLAQRDATTLALS